MALISTKGICIPDDKNGDELRAILDGADLTFNVKTKVVAGEWCEPNADGSDWVYTPMNRAEVMAFCREHGIKGWGW